MSKKPKKINYEINCSKKEAIEYINNKKHRYIKKFESDKNDINLALLWEDHWNIFCEYHYTANIKNGIINGMLYSGDYNKNENKMDFFESLKVYLYIIGSLLFFYSIIFIITFLIAKKLILSLIISGSLFLLYIIFFTIVSNNKKLHIQNLNDFFKIF